ncbi:vesicle-associated protein 1-3-like [Phoenix dactylifera]|uniref:Vesicle-associated protein 1-3-like n=1 Tax=Phoenix dactylifera TaxID=42345 RepID=A0A8B7BWT3_PHODC|nr:vesicle-associated protein 1-3-like [Phoenix dactylifera]
MSGMGLLKIRPSDLRFPFELKKQITCCVQLTNKTDRYVAFKVKTTNPKKYCVRPKTGIVLPRTTCSVTVMMQAQNEAPPDNQCKDKFLIQSVVAADGATTKDITPEMFNKAPDKVVDEFKLRVVYIPANPPSPVPEEPEEGWSPRSLDNGTQTPSLFDNVSKSHEEPSKGKLPEALTMISKLAEEKGHAIQQNQKIRQELFWLQELLKKQRNLGRSGFSVVFVAIVAFLGVLFWYTIKKT